MSAQSNAISPIGTPAARAAARRASESAIYRAQSEARGGFRGIAWLLIKYRMEHGLTQQQLAQLVGTSHSQVSRIESGRHRTSLETLERIAHALDLRLIVGFEKATGGRRVRDLVTI
ncbi:MAG: helix-turn-helix transcriptional regulator [Candidatus Dormibacteria bacterium]